jgi:hypothetical protein
MYIENFKNIIFQSKRILILRIIGLVLFIQVIISFNLWFESNATFPKIPLFESLNHINPIFHQLLSIVFLGSVISLIIAQEANLNKVLFVLNSIIIINIFFDLNRFQVWIYFYFIIFLTVLLIKDNHESRLLNHLRILIGAVYFWSGIYKFNIHYLDTFEWLISEFTFLKNIKIDNYIAYFSSFLEASLGLLILTNKFKNLAFVFTILMHLFIVLNLILLDWNMVVIPWNLLMVGLVYFSFYQNEDKAFKFKLKKDFFTFIIVFMLPFLYFFEAVPSTISFCMYSGRESTATLVFNSKESKLKILNPVLDNQKVIGVDLDYWSSLDKNVPIFSHDYYFEKMNKTLCKSYFKLGYQGLIINKYPIQTKEYKIKCPCEKI